LSSTTDHSGERGQTLPLFALAIVVLLGFAALAFDGGQMLLDRRAEQNAADAAALAGARYIPTSSADARNEAMRLAYRNGYGAGPTFASSGVAGPNGTVVTVKVPPGPESAFSGQSGYVEVQITSTRPSIFGAVVGLVSQRTGALATASNRTGAAANYSMLALNPTACSSAKFGGSGSVSVAGNIMVDSSSLCSQGAFNQGGASSITVTSPGGSIDVVGGASCAAGHCTPVPTTGQQYVPDPLASLPAPGVPAIAAPVVRLAGTQDIPAGCPGGSGAATALAPATCAFNNSYNGSTWLLSPGYYPGGFQFLKGTFFLKPGVYYIGGGGLDAAGGGASIYSVAASWGSVTPPSTCTSTSFSDCGGVLFYNTNDPAATSGGASAKDMQPISLNGASASVQLYPIQNAGAYTNIVIFQDRNLPSATSGDLQLNGHGSNLHVQGTIYEPKGYVAVQGTGNLGPGQIIADTFSITGSGTLAVGYNQDLIAQLIAVGLVE
jgi:Flp pilus assembly protein TadG